MSDPYDSQSDISSSFYHAGPIVPDFWIRTILNYAGVLESLRRAAADSLELSFPFPDTPDQPVTARQEALLLERLCRLSENPLIHLDIAATHNPRIGALPVYIVFSGDTLGRQLGALRRYMVLSRPNGRIEFSSVRDQFVITIGNADPWIAQHFQHVEFSLALLLRLVQEATKVNFKPIKILLGTKRAEHASLFRQKFQAPVEFGAPQSQIIFSSTLVDMPTVTADKTLHAHLTSYGDTLLSQRNNAAPSFEDQIKSAILRNLHSGSMTSTSIAAELGLSTRTLARRLDELGHTFRSLVTKLRMEMADLHLADPTMSLAEIAFRLGFSDQSTFGAAYRRHAGRTPGQAREAARSKESPHRY